MLVSESLVQSALQPYELDETAAYHVRLTVWRSAIEALLGRGAYDAQGRDLIMRLRRPLNIGDDDVLTVERDLILPFFATRVRAASEGPIERFDRDVLLREGVALNVPSETTRRLVSEASDDAFKRFWNSLAFETNASGEVIRRALTTADIERVHSVATALGIQLSQTQERRLVNETRLQDMVAGHFKAVRVPINLARGEHCLLETPSTWHEPRSTRYGAELTTVDAGILYITTKRVVFSGIVKTAALKFENLLDIDVHPIGFRCRKPAGRSPFFHIGDDTAFLANLLVLWIFRQIRNGQLIDVIVDPAVQNESHSAEATRQPATRDSQSSLAAPAATLASRAKGSASQGIDRARLEKAMSDLNRLTGLAPVKQEVTSLVNLAKLRAMRAEQGLPVPPITFHLVFTGRPGTGKTMVARILGEVFAALGTLPEGQLVETDRSGLVGGYVGQTALKTTDVLRSALGGILFIDEAYALAGRGENDFGTEAIETLLKTMEDHRAELIVIVAGYKAEMDTFLNANPGLRSRFTRYINFPDYSAGELLAIFSAMVSAEGFDLATEAHVKAGEIFSIATLTAGPNFGNARLARNVFERAVAAQANRLASVDAPTRDELCLLTEDDIPTSQDVL